MKKTPLKSLFLFILIIFALAVRADDVTTVPVNADSIVFSYTGNEVVIQSFKSNDNISQLPVSATLLSAETLRERNIANIKEFSGYVPNFFIPDYGSKMVAPAFIRGIGSAKNAPSIGLYVDGVPYFDRSTLDISMEDVERIEVLRGPQGTIYGRNTMGGIINVYTKSPFKHKETNVGVSAGNYNTYRVNASHYGALNNTLGYSLSGDYRHTGGYITNRYTGKRANPMDEASVRMKLSWKATDDLFLNLTSAYEYSDQDGYPYAPYDNETNTVGSVDYNSHSYYRRNMSTTGLNVQYMTDRIRFNSQSSFQYFDGRQGLDQDFTSQDQFYVLFDHRQRMYSQEFNLKSVDSEKYEWLFGAFGFYQDYATFNNINYLQPQTAKLQDASTPSMGAALFHQSVLSDLFVKGLTATFGIRYDWERIKAHTILSDVDKEGNRNETSNRRDRDTYSQLTPKFALQYAFNSDDMVYASVSKGYKAGGFNNTAQVEDERSFDPEQSWSYEVGAKASCLNGLINTDFSLFYIDWKDQQISQLQPNGQGFIQRNAGKSSSKGVEANIQVNPFKNLSFLVNYGYTRAKFKEYDDLKGNDYSGKYLPLVPSNTFSVAADYTMSLRNNAILDKVVFNAQYSGVGRLYWKEDNVAYQNFYGLVNGRISLVKKNISLDFWSKNIGGKEYVAYYFATSSGSYAQRGKPFMCGVDLKVKF